MVRSVRCCRGCQRQFVSNGGATLCGACHHKRQSTESISASSLVQTSSTQISKPHDFFCKNSPSSDFIEGIQSESPFRISSKVEDPSNVKDLFGGVEVESKSNSEPQMVARESGNNETETTAHSKTARVKSNGRDQEDICFICGADLSKMKFRINHIKRCSKQHSISGRDVRDNSEGVQNDSNNKYHPTNGECHTPHREPFSASVTHCNNPYTKRNDWHGDAKTLLEISNQSSNETEEASQKEQQQQPQKQMSLTNFLTVPARNLNNVLMAASRRLSKESELIAAQKRKRASEVQLNENGNPIKRGRFGKASSSWSRRKEYVSYSCPQYKKIPGTDFVVDGFHYAKESLTKNYFLTHYHSDHYGGIDSTWHLGTIYCSLPTANLVNQQLGVDKKYIHPLPMHTATVIASRGTPITVTLLDANHCPGAVMFLFEVGKRRILHVGDFRWNREVMLQQPLISQIASNQIELDDLFLDTTYCDPKYALPSQNDAVEAVIDLFQQQRAQPKRTLHLFGAYTIGKERMFLSVAERFGMKVYVDPSRYRTLSALEWPKERMRLLTSNKEESCIWVVPLGHINMKKIPEYFDIAHTKPFAPSYDQIIGYRPTGWSLSSKPSAGIVATRKSDKKVTIHSIPYSEHSSFPELLDCLACLRPTRIVPTVNAGKSKEQVETLLSCLRMKQTQIRLGTTPSK